MFDHMIFLKDLEPITTSLKVAEMFGKWHSRVLQDINALEIKEDFHRSNFKLNSFKDTQGDERPMYYITKDGFTILTTSYYCKESMDIKVACIGAFNKRRDKVKEKLRQTDQRKMTLIKEELNSVKRRMAGIYEKREKATTDYSSIAQYCDDRDIKSTYWPKNKIERICSIVSEKNKIPFQYLTLVIDNIFKIMDFHGEKKAVSEKDLERLIKVLADDKNCNSACKGGNCG